MRAKLSSTADGTYRSFASTAHAGSDFFVQAGGQTHPSHQISSHQLDDYPAHGTQRANRSRQAIPADLRGEGLLHDARNLVSAIGLYCDLLSMPGVLKPEHKQYPEELRLLGTRSRVLIEHLMRSLVTQNLSEQDQTSSLIESTSQIYPADRRPDALSTGFHAQPSAARTRPISLRTTVERCSGLLTRVANGHPIEVIYGAAADVPIAISEEAVERILVNLVRNASQALDREPRTSPTERELHAAQRHTDLPHRRHAASSQADAPPAIRITVGPLLERLGEARSWPFQHVRLVVEDFGCGMDPRQLNSLLSGPISASRGTHGIGFRVVRELIAASNGDLRAASTHGVGTQIQIEWPVAGTAPTEKEGILMQRKRELGSTAKPPIKRQHRPLPLPSSMVEVRGGVN